MKYKKIQKIKKNLDLINDNLSSLEYDQNILNLIKKSDKLIENYKKIQDNINNEEKVLVSFKKLIKSLFIRKKEKKYVLFNNTSHTRFIYQ